MKAGEGSETRNDEARARIAELEEQLRRAESCDLYRDFFEHSGDAILLIDGDTFIDCNEATVRMLRYSSREELLQTHPSDLSPEFQPDGRRSFDKANEMIDIAFQHGSHRFEWSHVRADGEVFPVEVLLTAVKEGEKTILHVGWRDITERKRLEVELRQAQKMEAIGKLAGGIAHDFNNLLVAVLGYSDLLIKQVGDQPELRQPLEQIGLAAGRAATLTAQLLAFSRKQALQPRVIDLGATLSTLEPMLSALSGEAIALEFERPSTPAFVKVDPTQMEQVILNLVTNARDAMPRGGTLQLSVAPTTLDRAANLDLRAGDYVCLRFVDSGEGMDPETRERALEPFFTTKEKGKGTGLGLSSVYGIIKQSGGDIRISSRRGDGTKVEVFLPLTTELPASSPPLQPVPSATADRPGIRILVVEDDAMVAALVRRVLSTAGYSVIEARSGVDALAALEKCDYSCDLLLTDVVMPDISGPEIVRKTRQGGHDLAVLFMSGYTDDTLAEHGFEPEEVDLLRKPFSTTDLLDRVAAAIAAGENAGRASGSQRK